MAAYPSRRSIRLPGFDYSAPGAYFITINVQNREPLFGECTHQGICLNDLGRIVEDAWITVAKFFPIELDEYSIMPDHFHALLWFLEENGKRQPSIEDVPVLRGTQPRSLEALVQNFKSITAKCINQIRKSPGMRVWQRNYYEHVVRDEQDLANIRQYIRENPYRKAPTGRLRPVRHLQRAKHPGHGYVHLHRCFPGCYRPYKHHAYIHS